MYWELLFNVQDYPENKDIVVCLDEGNINLTLPTEKIPGATRRKD